MKLRMSLLVLLAFMLAVAGAAFADDAKSGAEHATPEPGPPKESAERDWMIGTWDVVMKNRMDPSTENWTESKGVAVYTKVAGGAAIKTDFTSTMMEMPFEGLSLTCYDRELRQWQTTWVDNMSGRISLYTGKCDKSGSVFQGEELWMGQKSLSRLSSVNKSATAFDWKMESSMDGGKTWAVMMTASYTKRGK